jgi:hypothetical protein
MRSPLFLATGAMLLIATACGQATPAGQDYQNGVPLHTLRLALAFVSAPRQESAASYKGRAELEQTIGRTPRE